MEKRKQREKWQSLGRDVLDLLYPVKAKCLLCGGKGPVHSAGPDFCWTCQAEMQSQPTGEIPCNHCGRYFLRPSTEFVSFRDRFCPDCRIQPPQYQRLWAVGPYGGKLREAIQRLKYQGQQSLGQPLGRLMAQNLRQNWSRQKPYGERKLLVVPIPLHAQREQERGFNQAELLAQVVAQAMHWPLASDLLQRVVPTPRQTGLSREQRLRNLNGAFVFQNQRNLSQQGVLLVDDVVTTGATCTECSLCLQNRGWGPVYVLTLAVGRISEECSE